MDTQSGYSLAAEMDYKAVMGVASKAEVERAALSDVVLEGTPTYVKQLIAGGVAGGLSKTSVAPLERIKILYQVRVLSLCFSVSLLGDIRDTGKSLAIQLLH